jgi:hypothetical protein
MNSKQPPRPSAPFGGAARGRSLGPLTFTVSAAANERYWANAGVDHPALRSGALYPPLAANLTILLFQTVAPRPLLHTAQRLTCHRRAPVGAELTVTGVVTDRYEKRGRDYAEVTATVRAAGRPLWTSVATFCEIEPSRGPR